MFKDNRWEDTMLLQKIKQKDELSMESLYDRYCNLVFSLVLRIVGNLADAEEATQEVFLKLWRNANQFDQTKGSPFSWIVSIARSQAIDKTRSRLYKQSKVEQPFDIISENESPIHGNYSSHNDSLVGMREESQTVTKAVQSLALKNREVIELAYFKGLTHAGIAKRLDLPIGTVKTRLRSSIRKLQKILNGKF